MSDSDYFLLSSEEEEVIVYKGTEPPFKGRYTDHFEVGVYLCKQCHAPLYRSQHKFVSSCGWPSFDEAIKDAVTCVMDRDGYRTEIICRCCKGHLGHLFCGEQLTAKNERHCVNSISLMFETHSSDTFAYFAGGCFWGVEYFFSHKRGVISVLSGYMGGDQVKPTYQHICSGTTGHLEVVEVSYDNTKVSYRELVRFFFEIHDPTQLDRQGPDIGSQYASALFYNTESEKIIAEESVTLLCNKGMDVVTVIRPSVTFWKAEDEHQRYYENTKKVPYCHCYTKRF